MLEVCGERDLELVRTSSLLMIGRGGAKGYTEKSGRKIGAEVAENGQTN